MQTLELVVVQIEAPAGNAHESARTGARQPMRASAGRRARMPQPAGGCGARDMRACVCGARTDALLAARRVRAHTHTERESDREREEDREGGREKGEKTDRGEADTGGAEGDKERLRQATS